MSFVFIGSGILFLTHSVNINHFIEYASLDVILFLVGMMIVVGAMKESGLFHLLVTALLRGNRLSGAILFVVIMVFSAVLSALAGEVTSVIVMTAVILEICDSLKVNPVPLVVSSVMTTNVGSASTLLGNPIGVLIALRGHLNFEDFLIYAMPVSAVVLVIVIVVLCIWYRSYIKEISAGLAARSSVGYVPASVSFDSKKKICVLIFAVMILSIGLHKRLGSLFSVDENSLLVILPVIFSGIVMLYRHDKVRHYIEKEVEWMSLLFFMFLFAQAGVIQSSGVAQFVAEKLVKHAGTSQNVLSGVTLFSSGLLSGILDNTVVVASYIPVVKNLHVMDVSLRTLWWAMLFGACFGGNLTAIGSTANIVALGLLEQRKLKVSFYQWLKLGAIVTVVGMLIAYFSLIAFLGSPTPAT